MAMDLDYVREPFAGADSYRVINPRIRDQFLRIINRMYGVRNPSAQKFPGAQPCSIMRQDLERLGRDHYVVAEKTDGTRYLMLVTRTPDGIDFSVMVDRSLTMWIVQLQFSDVVFQSTTLFDGELVRNEYENKWMYQIFDLIGSGREFRFNDSYIQRLKNARTIVDRFHFKRPEDAFEMVVKRFYPTHKIDQLVSSMRMQQGCRTDGLIFTPVRLYVKPYRNRVMYKWKQQEDNTADFLLRYNAEAASKVRLCRVENLHRSTMQGKDTSIKSSPPQTPVEDVSPSLDDDNDSLDDFEQCPTRRRVHIQRVSKMSVLLLQLLHRCKQRASKRALADAAERLQVDVESSNDDDFYALSPTSTSTSAQAEVAVSSSSSSDNLSPSKIELGAFEFWLTNTNNDLVHFANVNVELNRGFLVAHGLNVAAGEEPIVECAFDAAHRDWSIHKLRTDRRRPNAEFTVQRTVANIQENITLDQIVAVARENKPPALGQKRPRPDCGPNNDSRRGRLQPSNPFLRQPVSTFRSAPPRQAHAYPNMHPQRQAMLLQQNSHLHVSGPPPAGFDPAYAPPLPANGVQRPPSPEYGPPPVNGVQRPPSPEYGPPPSPEYRPPPSPIYAPPGTFAPVATSSTINYSPSRTFCSNGAGDFETPPSDANGSKIDSVPRVEDHTPTEAPPHAEMGALLTSLSTAINSDPSGTLAQLLSAGQN